MTWMKQWPLWSKILFGALVLYSGWLFVVSISVFFEAWKQHWALKAPDIAIQIIMALFLPLLLVGLRNTRAASGGLFLLVLADTAMLLVPSRWLGDGTAAMFVGSLLFFGVPALGSAIFLHAISRRLAAQKIVLDLN
jgi:hypothetical protein